MSKIEKNNFNDIDMALRMANSHTQQRNERIKEDYQRSPKKDCFKKTYHQKQIEKRRKIALMASALALCYAITNFCTPKNAPAKVESDMPEPAIIEESNTDYEEEKELALQKILQDEQAGKYFSEISETLQNITSQTGKNAYSLLQNISEKYPDIDPLLLCAQIYAESSGLHFKDGEINASSLGYKGFMQMGDDAASDVIKKYPEYKELDIDKPVDNIKLGSGYLQICLSRCKGNIKEALASYNAGYGNRDCKEAKDYANKICNIYGALSKLDDSTFIEMSDGLV